MRRIDPVHAVSRVRDICFGLNGWPGRTGAEICELLRDAADAWERYVPLAPFISLVELLMDRPLPVRTTLYPAQGDEGPCLLIEGGFGNFTLIRVGLRWRARCDALGSEAVEVLTEDAALSLIKQLIINAVEPPAPDA
ncbi:hypothetical protein ACWDWV_00265 [Streptosporangium sandarakinum]